MFKKVAFIALLLLSGHKIFGLDNIDEAKLDPIRMFQVGKTLSDNLQVKFTRLHGAVAPALDSNCWNTMQTNLDENITGSLIMRYRFTQDKEHAFWQEYYSDSLYIVNISNKQREEIKDLKIGIIAISPDLKKYIISDFMHKDIWNLFLCPTKIPQGKTKNDCVVKLCIGCDSSKIKNSSMFACSCCYSAVIFNKYSDKIAAKLITKDGNKVVTFKICQDKEGNLIVASC